MHTLPNIRIDSDEWLNVYDNLDGINYGQKIRIENVGSCDIYITENDEEPSLSNTSYSVLKPRQGYFFSQNESIVWAYSGAVDGLINVSLSGDTVNSLLTSIDNKVEEFVNQTLCDNKKIIKELMLLNARFEEMADTRINNNDLREK